MLLSLFDRAEIGTKANKNGGKGRGDERKETSPSPPLPLPLVLKFVLFVCLFVCLFVVVVVAIHPFRLFSAEISREKLASHANESEVIMYYLSTNLYLSVTPDYLCITQQTPPTMTINNAKPTANTNIGITGNKS